LWVILYVGGCVLRLNLLVVWNSATVKSGTLEKGCHSKNGALEKIVKIVPGKNKRRFNKTGLIPKENLDGKSGWSHPQK
jgi:hypothetical protein